LLKSRASHPLDEFVPLRLLIETTAFPCSRIDLKRGTTLWIRAARSTPI
jgi:hypothetical protein